MTHAPGDRVGPYTLERLERRTGPHALWRANSGIIGASEVILKLPEDESISFERELAALERLDDEFVWRCFNTGSEGGQVYLVFEAFEGSFLDEKLESEDKRLSPDEALEILDGVLSALQHIHDRQVFHGNLKPDNILILTDGRVKLADFSLAELRSRIGERWLDFEDRVEGQISGTFGFIAPERLCGARNDAQGDLYAFGAVLFEVLTGKPLFERGDLGMWLAQLERQPGPLEALWPELSPVLEPVYLRLVAKDRAERFRTAAEAHEALIRALTAPEPEPVLDLAKLLHMQRQDSPDPVWPKPGFCPHCGTALASESMAQKSCPQCLRTWSTMFKATVFQCRACGAAAGLGNHCIACGQALGKADESTPLPPPVSEAPPASLWSPPEATPGGQWSPPDTGSASNW